MMGKSVLISGCGIAGPTLAYFLAEAGFRPTIVERAKDLRSSGGPVDVRGEAVEIAERIGIYDKLAERVTGATHAVFVDAKGRPDARLEINPGSRGGRAELEVPRSDLAAVLYEACRDRVEVVFDDEIASLTSDDSGVDVTFEHGAPRRFDFVVGADGLHSAVRRLAFGPESTFVRHAGLYVATVKFDAPFDVPLGDDRTVLIHNAPGRMAAVHPNRGSPGAAFIFRHPALTAVDPWDIDAHRRLLAETYAHDGWCVPKLLEHVAAASDLYFDSVSRVRIEPWHRGRIVLAGDAASCLSLLGEGSTLAMIAGATLARTLGEEHDLNVAFTRYETQHRRRVGHHSRAFPIAAAFLVPKTAFGIATRNALTRLIARALSSRLFERSARGE
jgi:2-polyprenyl-6-methoxyphenol hydroxylase-like FAD-dependent oxidoreductase